ncbi:MAG: PadR family transcriptional regulator [Nitrososphaerota archaeon]
MIYLMHLPFEPWPLWHVGRAKHLWGRLFKPLRRGDFRLLVLEVLKKRPMHGYEVAKEISELFGGFYEPSPGIVYPTLQWLEDEGYVRADQVDGKKVYSITEAGKKFLESKEDSIKRVMETCTGFLSDERFKLFSEGRKLAQTVLLLLTDATDEQLREAAKIIEDARKRIAELMIK